MAWPNDENRLRTWGMRGPLFSGAVGHRLTLTRLAGLVSAAEPIVVLSTVWLAEVLCEVGPVHLIIERRRLRAAQRARLRAERLGRTLSVIVAAEALPLRSHSLGAIVVDELAELEDDEMLDYLAALVPYLRPKALLLGLDRTKDPLAESRISGGFLASTLQGLGQERPREGALITVGAAPSPAIVRTLAACFQASPLLSPE